MERTAGKLRAAVRWVLTPADDDAAFDQDRDTEASLRRLGVTDEQLAAGRRAQAEHAAPELLALWAWHLPPFRVFSAMRRQWRVVAQGPALFFVGLDLGVLAEVERRLRIEPLLDWQFDALLTMEREGATLLNA